MFKEYSMCFSVLESSWKQGEDPKKVIVLIIENSVSSGFTLQRTDEGTERMKIQKGWRYRKDEATERMKIQKGWRYRKDEGTERRRVRLTYKALCKVLRLQWSCSRGDGDGGEGRRRGAPTAHEDIFVPKQTRSDARTLCSTRAWCALVFNPTAGASALPPFLPPRLSASWAWWCFAKIFEVACSCVSICVEAREIDICGFLLRGGHGSVILVLRMGVHVAHPMTTSFARWRLTVLALMCCLWERPVPFFPLIRV
jgi:hypothetical protein